MITEETVQCPVSECSTTVQRQRKHFRKEPEYRCDKHAIFISPSTFEYGSYLENLLWKDSEDLELLKDLFRHKRESRMSRDNSEDAVTWNVFRFLQKSGMLPDFLNSLSNGQHRSAELILWSYSLGSKAVFSPLHQARLEFGEIIARGSEPDVIIVTEDTLFIVEAKLMAKNKTKPSRPSDRKHYETGGGSLFQEVFSSEYGEVAIDSQRYELMRYWLLGNWMARKMARKFELYTLTLENRENSIEKEFDRHIIETSERKFSRMSWEGIYRFLLGKSGAPDQIFEYFRNKTIGYDANGGLMRAFQI